MGRQQCGERRVPAALDDRRRGPGPDRNPTVRSDALAGRGEEKLMPFPTPHRSSRKAGRGLLRAILCGCGIALAASTARAGERAGLVSLELPVGTRARGMGGACVSVSDDPTAMFWNPAGLARLGVPEKHFDIMFQHNEWLDDFRQEFVAGATRIGRHAFGGSFSGFYINDLEGRDESGLPTVNFGAYDAVTTGSYAFKFN